MITFKYISFTVKLNDAQNTPVNDLALFVQYFNFSEQKWINIYRSIVSNGSFFCRGPVSSTLKDRQPFLEAIQKGLMLPIRIVPTQKIYDSKQKEIIGMTFDHFYNPENDILEFDFGSMWLMPENSIEKYATYHDFVTIASLYPPELTSVKENTDDIPIRSIDGQYEEQLNECTTNLQTVTSQYEKLYSTHQTLMRSNQATLILNEELEGQLSSLKNDLRDQELQIQKLQDTIAALSAEENPTEGNQLIPINSLYSNILGQVETVNKSTENSAFKLSNLSLKLKAIIQKDGENLSASLLDSSLSDTINGNSISELSFEITPTQNQNPATTKIPELSGLTETAVRRVLQSISLRLNPVYQQNLNVVHGSAFKQSPEPGTTIQPNQLVTVIFSKHE